MGTQVEAVTRAFTDSEQRLAEALREHSRTFGFKLVSLEAELRDKQDDTSRTFGIKLQSLEAELRDNKSDAIARALSESDRRLSDQLARSGWYLSATFGQELRSQAR